MTLKTALEQTGQTDLPVEKTWRLNERHYGALTGLNKAETAAKHGEEQVKIWRRSFDVPPPPMESDHPYHETIRNDPRYKDGPSDQEFPTCESLKLTIERTLPYWDDVIVPQMKVVFILRCTYNKFTFIGWQEDSYCCSWKLFKRNCETS